MPTPSVLRSLMLANLGTVFTFRGVYFCGAGKEGNDRNRRNHTQNSLKSGGIAVRRTTEAAFFTLGRAML